MADIQSQMTIEGVASTSKDTQPRPMGTLPKAKRVVARPKSEIELLSEISAKLDRAVAVLAAQGKDRDTQAAILAAAGCDSTFLAMFFGITPGAVRNLPGWRRAKGESPNAPEDAP